MTDIKTNCQFCGKPITRSVKSGMTCENYCTDKWVRWDRLGRPNYQRYLKKLGRLDEALEEYAKLNDLLFKHDGTQKYSQQGELMDKTYIAYYRSYFYDQHDRCVEISREEYEKLLPYEHELRNSNSITQELSDFVWDKLYNRNDFDQDVFEEMDDEELEVIEIAVC